MDTKRVSAPSGRAVMGGLAVLFMLLAADLRGERTSNTGTRETIRQKNDETVVRLTRYAVKRQHRVAFRKLLGDYARHSMMQKGNVLSEAYYEQENTAVLWLIERWENNKELEKAGKGPKFKVIESISGKVLAEPARVFNAKDLEPLSKQQWRQRPQKQDKPITIMLFVDARDGTENDFKNIYHEAMPAFRGEPGVVNYQLSQLSEDHTRFVTYEKFRGEDAFQYHLNFPPIKPVLDYLNTSIENPPFQNGIHKLVRIDS